MVASIPYRNGSRTPIDMSYAADVAAAKPGIPQGKVSAVTAKRMRRQIREAKKREKEEAKEAVKAETAAAAGVKFVEEILIVNDMKVRSSLSVNLTSYAAHDTIVMPSLVARGYSPRSAAKKYK